MNLVIVRPTEPHEVKEVLRLQEDWVREGSTYGYVTGTMEDLERAVGPYFLAAIAGDRLVGFTIGAVAVSRETTIFNDEGASYLEIQELYVAPDSRGHGVGGQLLAAVRAAARNEGIERSLVCSSTRDLSRVIRFYQREGFETWSVLMFRREAVGSPGRSGGEGGASPPLLTS